MGYVESGQLRHGENGRVWGWDGAGHEESG